MLTRPNCKVCASPLRAEAEAQFRVQPDRKAVYRFLAAQGQSISYASVKTHFARHYTAPVSVPTQPVVAAPVALATGVGLLAVLDEGHALALRQVRQLAEVETDTRNIGPISASLFRGIDLLARQVDLRARLLGYYQPADESTIFQIKQFASRLAAVVAALPDEQRLSLASALAELGIGGEEANDA